MNILRSFKKFVTQLGFLIFGACLSILVIDCSSPSLAKPQTISLGPQSGKLTSGIPGTVTFTASTSSVGEGMTGSLTWYQTAAATTSIAAPSRIIATVTPITSSTATITIKTDSTIGAGSYYFTLTEDQAVSTICTLIISPCPVTLGFQSGTITSGTIGQCSFSVSTSDVSDNTVGTFAWFTSALGTTAATQPLGITPTVSIVSNNVAIVTINATSTAAAGTYFFSLLEGSASSAIATLTVLAPAPIPPSVDLASQSGVLIAGTAGSCTFAVTTISVPDNTWCSIIWYSDANGLISISQPVGIFEAVPTSIANNSATVTITSMKILAAGKYYFGLTVNVAGQAVVSPIATLEVSSVTLGSQSIFLTSGTPGAATFTTSTSGVSAGTNGTFSWYTAADGISVTTPPPGITASVSATVGETATVTMNATSSTVPGTYYFTLKEGAVVSKVTDLYVVSLVNMIAVPGGTFQRDSTPTNLSTVASFNMSQYLITGAQYAAITGLQDPSKCSESNHPVETVSWYDALVFCNDLSLSQGKTPVYSISGSTVPSVWIAAAGGTIPSSQNSTWDNAAMNTSANGYRLPTEMEYMWAMMGGLSDSISGDIISGINIKGYLKGYSGSNEPNGAQYGIANYAWYFTNSPGTTQAVGTKAKNELGIYDLSGNVFEWIWDWYGGMPVGSTTNYQGPSSGSLRVGRGGNYGTYADACSVSYRSNPWSPNLPNENVGLRVVTQ